MLISGDINYDKIFEISISALNGEEDISNKEDFDFHTSSILRLLGMKGSFNTMQALIGGEIKRLVQNKA